LKKKGKGNAMKHLGFSLAALGVIAVLFAQLFPLLATGYLSSGMTSAFSRSQYGAIQNVGIFLIVVGLIVSHLQNIVPPPTEKKAKKEARRFRPPASEELPPE